jgi:diguanylate cyclase (GGDEF)-like protein
MKTPNDSLIQSESLGNILIVDDNAENLRVLETLLTRQGYEVRGVVNGQAALRASQTAPPDLILLDIMMPDMTGYEVCKKLKANTKTETIPIVFLSALDEVFDKVRAFSSGGVDYITKPFQFDEVLVRIETHLSLHTTRNALKALNTELELRVVQRTAQLEKEIEARQSAQQQLLHLALHDPLTGLPNRAWFGERLSQALESAKQHSSYRFAVLYLDCDRFKIINDSLGHSLGDRLLVSVARRLEACLLPVSMLARLGGDEFAILMEDISSEEEAIQAAERVNRELSLIYTINQHEIFMNACIGIAIGDGTYEQPEHLLRDADTAMYHAKSVGKARYQVFNSEMHLYARKRLQLEIDLQRATEKAGAFIVYYQPIVAAENQQITGMEALVRWPQKDGSIRAPDRFIKTAEETELIIPIDLWVIQTAAEQLRQWKMQFPDLDSFTISVNLSAKHFLAAHQSKLLEVIDALLVKMPVLKDALKLEITESSIIDDPEGTIRFLHQLKQRRILLSIDDFGTGYSSLTYLHQFPVNTLKIDRWFVQQVNDVTQNVGIIQTIATLGHQLGLTLTAEGVETEQQLSYVKSLGCQEAQGYLFSPPVSAAAATDLLRRRQLTLAS